MLHAVKHDAPELVDRWRLHVLDCGLLVPGRKKHLQVTSPQRRIRSGAQAFHGRPIEHSLETHPDARSGFRTFYPKGPQNLKDMIDRDVGDRLVADHRHGVVAHRLLPLPPARVVLPLLDGRNGLQGFRKDVSKGRPVVRFDRGLTLKLFDDDAKRDPGLLQRD